MKIPTPFLSAIELAINTWLKLDDNALPQFKEPEGKIIRFHITDLDINLYFLPAASGIQVLGNYPDPEDGGVLDATIHGSTMALIRLSISKNSGETLLKSDVEIEGDMRTAEKFSAVLREVDIDWEELLSTLIGDFLAHRAAKTTQDVKEWLSVSTETLKTNTAEYLTEDSDLSPTATEISEFIDQVDEIRQDVDRLDARIKLLHDSIQDTDSLNDKGNKEKK